MTDATRLLTTLWRLAERDHPRVMAATVWTHPLGVELRVLIDGTLLRSQVYKDGAELLQRAAEDRDRLIEKGWRLLEAPDEPGERLQ